MDHGGYSNKLRGKHKVSTYKFPWKTDKLELTNANSILEHWRNCLLVGLSTYGNYCHKLTTKEKEKGCLLTGESYVQLFFMSKVWTTFFPADKRWFDTTNPICSVSQRSYSCMGSLLISKDKQSKNQIFTFKSVCICLCECVHIRSVWLGGKNRNWKNCL